MLLKPNSLIGRSFKPRTSGAYLFDKVFFVFCFLFLVTSDTLIKLFFLNQFSSTFLLDQKSSKKITATGTSAKFRLVLHQRANSTRPLLYFLICI